MTRMRWFRTSRKFATLCFAAFALGSCSGGGDEQDLGPMIQTDLPFVYTVGPKALHVSTAGGTVYVHLGAYGAHFMPHTGHASGDLKSNLAGFLVPDIASLTELAGDGDGVCEPGETCGFDGGAGGANIRNRIPLYSAPMAATLRRVTMNALPGPGYFDGVPHWEIELSLSPRFTLRIGHLGRIAPPLRDKVLAATGINTDTYAGPVGHVLNGGAIPVAAGEALAYPQVFALPVPMYPGYHRGGGTFSAIPWAQMEFTVADHAESAEVCVYDLLDPAKKTAIQLAMDADMADTASPRWGPYWPKRWTWAAQGLLCTAYSPNPRDFGSLHTNLGGWTERPSSGTTIDETFSMVKIHKTAGSYSAGNYDSGAVNHLVLRVRLFSNFSWTMPDASVVSPFLPAGEVISETADSLLVKWRDIGWTGPAYQRAAFRLDAQGLKVKWGDFSATAVGAVPPVLGAAEACNDVNVLCYDHVPRL